jgi:hypothetical protein
VEWPAAKVTGVRKWVAAAGLLTAAVVIWLTIFFGGAYAVVWLVETFEGEISECGRGECERFGEFLDDHDLLAVVLLAFVAASPAVPLLWKARRRFANRDANPS